MEFRVKAPLGVNRIRLPQKGNPPQVAPHIFVPPSSGVLASRGTFDAGLTAACSCFVTVAWSVLVPFSIVNPLRWFATILSHSFSYHNRLVAVNRKREVNVFEGTVELCCAAGVGVSLAAVSKGAPTGLLRGADVVVERVLVPQRAGELSGREFPRLASEHGGGLELFEGANFVSKREFGDRSLTRQNHGVRPALQLRGGSLSVQYFPNAPCDTRPFTDLLSILDGGLKWSILGPSTPLRRARRGFLNTNAASFILHIQGKTKHAVDKPIRAVVLRGRVVCLVHPLSFLSVSYQLQSASCLKPLSQIPGGGGRKPAIFYSDSTLNWQPVCWRVHLCSDLYIYAINMT